MAKKPDAVDQYLEYLRRMGAIRNAWISSSVSVAQIRLHSFSLKMALLSPDIVTKSKDLDLAVVASPYQPPLRPSDLPHIKIPVSVRNPAPDRRTRRKAARALGTSLPLNTPRKSILGLSLVQHSLLLLIPFPKPETSFLQSAVSAENFRHNEKQFLWTALSALAKTQKWN
ncbi:hypothetical protein BV898_18205 [Hypsibius exemplaris]|uniref:Uncharacterized protein n=1 Tax=Hypsibius exemplaris TaxID=2072580 RepID=A0A9X6NPZ1_HYPEX|nr:hypothetical protein BV898_18205 [Hypsibius exemplaris]